MNAGRSAAAISSPSAAHAASSGAAPTSSSASPLGTSPDDGPNTSSGKSRKTGPRCGRPGEACGLEHHRAGRRRIGDRRRRLGDRRQDRHVVELLQRPRAPPTLRRPPAEHDERRPVEPRRRHRRDAVGDARPGGERRQPRSPGELGVGLGGERRRLLVAGVDDPHPLVARGLVERPDVAAVQREHHVGPELPQRGDGLLAGVSLDDVDTRCWRPRRRGCRWRVPRRRTVLRA